MVDYNDIIERKVTNNRGYYDSLICYENKSVLDISRIILTDFVFYKDPVQAKLREMEFETPSTHKHYTSVFARLEVLIDDKISKFENMYVLSNNPPYYKPKYLRLIKRISELKLPRQIFR